MIAILFSRPLFPGQVKDRTPTHQLSNVIYKFSCTCGSVYVGRTSQRLHIRMDQHVPKSFREFMRGNKTKTSQRKSKKTSWKSLTSIGKHLEGKPDCAKNYELDHFSVLARGRTDFHLKVLEAMYIKHLTPNLCIQKQFVHSVVLYNAI